MKVPINNKPNVPSHHKMRSPTGNPVPNQTVFSINGWQYFKSYNYIIACISPTGTVLLDEKYWKHSSTTSKYRNIFLNRSSKETLAKVTSGEYHLTDLNESY